MKQKTKKTTTEQIEATSEVAVVHLVQDVKTSVMIVSVLINVTVIALWVALLVTSKFDASLASFLLGR